MGLVNYFGHDCSLRSYKNLNLPFRMQLCGFNLAINTEKIKNTNIIASYCGFTEFAFLFEDGKWYYTKTTTNPTGSGATTNANTGDFTFSVNGVPMIARVVNMATYSANYILPLSLKTNFWGQENSVSRGYSFITKTAPQAITATKAMEGDFKIHSWYIEIIQADTDNYAGIKGFSFFNGYSNQTPASAPAIRFYSTIGSFEYRQDKYYPDDWNNYANIAEVRAVNRRYFTMTLNDKVPLIEEVKGITAEQKD